MTNIVNRALNVVRDAYKVTGYNVQALSPSMQVVHLIGRLDSEVAQGGVLGWLINSTGPYGPDTVKALEAVEAHQAASIVREILAFFPGGMPAFDDQERIRQITAVETVAESRWSELGARLLDWPDDVNKLLQNFVMAHEADFF